MRKQGNKISIIGAGLVGSTTAFSILMRGLASDLVLVDLNRPRAEGEAMDLNHGAAFIPAANIRAGDYPDTQGSDILIFTAGASKIGEGETRLDLAAKNVAIFKKIVPEALKYSPDAVILIVSNPVDVLTYVAAKISGLPSGRVMGSGTVLDTSRLRFLLSEHTGLDPRNIHTYVLGEHGDSEVAAWSLTRVAGMSIADYCRTGGHCIVPTPEMKAAMAAEARDAAYHIIERKGATYYAIALGITRIVEAILRDERAVMTVSGIVGPEFGLGDVALSLPAVVGADGIDHFMQVELAKEEQEKLRSSANALRAVLDQVFPE